MIMLFAGLRCGELIALTAEDIDLDAKIIKVRRAVHFENNRPLVGATKTKAGEREIPIAPPLLDALKQRKLPESGYLLRTKSGEIMTLSSFRHVLKSYLWAHEKELNGLSSDKPTKAQRANWKDFRFRCHDLRHTYCTFLFDAGVDVQTARLWMGHKNIHVTMAIYTHLSKRRKQTSENALNVYFNELNSKK